MIFFRPTIFLATPESPDDKYYKQNYNVTVEFLANYAKAIIGKDNVVIFCDDRSCQKLKVWLKQSYRTFLYFDASYD